MTRSRVHGALIVVVAAVLLAACGGDNSSSSVATSATTATTAAATSTTRSSSSGSSTAVTASAALCSARQNLQTSVSDLQNVDIVKNGTTGIKDALTKVKDNLAAVRSAAGQDLQPQVTAFNDALTSLDTAVNGSGGAAAIAVALKDVVQSGTTLLTDLGKLSCS